MIGLLIGIAIGALQIVALLCIKRMLSSPDIPLKFFGGLLFLAKLAAIIGLLIYISSISLSYLIFAAGGMFVGTVLTISITIIRQNGRKGKADGYKHDSPTRS